MLNSIYGSVLLWECFRNCADFTVEEFDWVDLRFISFPRKKHSFGVSILWSPIRKSRVKAVIKLRIFSNIC